jgi:hypothetical protein
MAPVHVVEPAARIFIAMKETGRAKDGSNKG